MPLKIKILLINSAIVIMLILACSISYYGISKLNHANFWVDHTHKVVRKAEGILAAAVDMETGMRGFMLAGQDEFLEPYNGGKERFYKLIGELKNTVSDNPPQVARLGEVEKTINEWQEKVTNPAISFRREVGNNKTMDDVATLISKALGKKYFDKFRGQIKEFTDIELNLMVVRQKTAADNYKWTVSAILIIAIISLISSIALSLYLSNSITGPLKKIFGGLKTFSNLELNQVQKMFNEVIGNLRTQAKELNEASNSIGTSSGTLIDNTNSQGSSVEETSASIHEIASLIRNNSTEASKASERIKEIKEEVTDLHSMFNKIEESNNELKKLVDVIQNIGDKTEIIDDIVFQTKLLSFNASVEAERAGEHGRGFAVVAQEVANLAAMSGKSSVEIAGIVKNGVKTCESIVDSNASRVEKAAASMKKVAESIDIVSTSSAEIANASDEQSKGIDQVNQAMTQIHQSTQSTTAVAHTVDQSCQNLYKQAETISGIVSDLNSLTLGQSQETSSEYSIDDNQSDSSNTLKKREKIVQISNYKETDKNDNPKLSQESDGWNAM